MYRTALTCLVFGFGCVAKPHVSIIGLEGPTLSAADAPPSLPNNTNVESNAAQAQAGMQPEPTSQPSEPEAPVIPEHPPVEEPTVEDPPPAPAPRPDVLVISHSGQSNSIGSGGAPALSTQASATDSYWSAGALTPLLEVGLETHVSAMAQGLREASPASFASIHHRWGVGSTPYAGLKRGTAPYQAGLAALTQMYQAAVATHPGKLVRAEPLVWIHGETDEVLGASRAQYKQYLSELHTTWCEDVKTALGIDYCPRLALVQWACATSTQTGALESSETAVAMSEWARDNPSKGFVSHPAYASVLNANDVHYSNVGHQMNGYYLAKATRLIALEQQPFQPLSPGVVTCEGSTLHVPLIGGDGSNIVIDTTAVGERPFYGFDYRDETSDPATISSVSCSGRTCTIALSRACGAGARLRYAFSGDGTGSCGASGRGGPGGNVRDSDPTPVPQSTTQTLPNWLIAFDEAITVSAPQASTPTPFFSGQAAQVTTTGSWVSFRDDDGYDGAQTLSVALWLRAPSWPTSDQVVLAKWALNQRQFLLHARVSGGLRLFMAGTLTDATRYCDLTDDLGQAFKANTNYHIAIAKNQSNIRVFVNGVERACVLSGGGATTSVPSGGRAALTLGGYTNGVNSFVGLRAAHLAVFPGALSAEHVAQLYGGGVPGDPRELVIAPSHYWPLQGNFDDLGAAIGSGSKPGFPYGGVRFEAGRFVAP